MTLTLIDPEAAAKIEANRHRLRAGSWGGTDATQTVCMMSAVVAGAQSTMACVTAGWPEWLVNLNIYLFDAKIGADDENAARYDYALSVAQLVQTPRDYDRARDLFLIAQLDTGNHSALKSLAKLSGDYSQQRAAVEAVVALLHARLAGEDVTERMDAAADAANAAAYAADAANAAAYAARAATYAARASRAAVNAVNAANAAAAAYAVNAAAYAAYYVAKAATAAANAAARADLIAALSTAHALTARTTLAELKGETDA
jgi:hypothetical protein